MQYNAVHCVVTSGGLVPAIVQLIMFGLDVHVPLEGIINTKHTNKASGFRHILGKYVRGGHWGWGGGGRRVTVVVTEVLSINRSELRGFSTIYEAATTEELTSLPLCRGYPLLCASTPPMGSFGACLPCLALDFIRT